MTLEVFKYIDGQDQCIEYDAVEPGKYKTIVNINSLGEEEIIVLNCRPDNKLSYVYTIHPKTIVHREGKPDQVYFDKNTDVENRALKIKPGEKVPPIKVRERLGRNSFVMMKYELDHR